MSGKATEPRLRITGGTWRGKRLRVPSGLHLRPTQGKVREALFSRLQAWIPEARVIDLFAGSGGLGLEALSRGAGAVVFVERDGEALRALRANIAALGVEARCRVIAGDVFAFLRGELGAAAEADLVLADPPYGGLAAELAGALDHAAGIEWSREAIRAIECGTIDPDWTTSAGWRRFPERSYGKTRLVVEQRCLEGKE